MFVRNVSQDKRLLRLLASNSLSDRLRFLPEKLGETLATSDFLDLVYIRVIFNIINNGCKRLLLSFAIECMYNIRSLTKVFGKCQDL